MRKKDCGYSADEIVGTHMPGGMRKAGIEWVLTFLYPQIKAGKKEIRSALKYFFGTSGSR